jgi:hypothetical protein
LKTQTLMVVVLLLISMISIVALINGNNTNLAAQISPNSSLNKDATVPEFVVYGFLFRKVARLSKKTQELRSQGKISEKAYHPLKNEAALSEAQSIALEAISADCEQALAQQDEKAKKIIQAFRERFPPGELPKGTRLPPPPPELITMSQQRNAIILKARDQVRLAFGELAFSRFDTYAKFRYETKSSPAPPELGSEPK